MFFKDQWLVPILPTNKTYFGGSLHAIDRGKKICFDRSYCPKNIEKSDVSKLLVTSEIEQINICAIRCFVKHVLSRWSPQQLMEKLNHLSIRFCTVVHSNIATILIINI